MKIGKVATLAFATAMFAVMACGSAFATTYTYNGELVTTINTDHSISITYPSAGSIPVSAGDYLQWYNGFRNMFSKSLTVDLTQSTSPSGGLSAVIEIKGLSIPPTPSGGVGTIDQLVKYNVTSAGSHTIYANHVWHDGSAYTSPTDSQMSYY